LTSTVPGEPARSINHSCAPNCEARVRRTHLGLRAARDRSGGELTFNYADLQDARKWCRCAAGLHRYMVAQEYFEEVRRQEQRRAK
jgi:SET domain-containing protein